MEDAFRRAGVSSLAAEMVATFARWQQDERWREEGWTPERVLALWQERTAGGGQGGYAEDGQENFAAARSQDGDAAGHVPDADNGHKERAAASPPDPETAAGSNHTTSADNGQSGSVVPDRARLSKAGRDLGTAAIAKRRLGPPRPGAGATVNASSEVMRRMRAEEAAAWSALGRVPGGPLYVDVPFGSVDGMFERLARTVGEEGVAMVRLRLIKEIATADGRVPDPEMKLGELLTAADVARVASVNERTVKQEIQRYLRERASLRVAEAVR